MGLALPAIDTSATINLRNFKENRKEFKQHLESRLSFTTVHTDKTNIQDLDIVRLKNELYRHRLAGEDLRNRKKVGLALKDLSDENKRWITDGGQA